MSFSFDELCGLQYNELEKLAAEQLIQVGEFATKTQLIRFILIKQNPKFDDTPDGRRLKLRESEEKTDFNEKKVSFAPSPSPPLGGLPGYAPPRQSIFEQSPPAPENIPQYSPPRLSIFSPEPAAPNIPEYRPAGYQSIFSPDPPPPAIPEYLPPRTSVFDIPEPLGPDAPSSLPPKVSIFGHYMEEEKKVDLEDDFPEMSFVIPDELPPQKSVFDTIGPAIDSSPSKKIVYRKKPGFLDMVKLKKKVDFNSKNSTDAASESAITNSMLMGKMRNISPRGIFKKPSP